MMSLWDALRMNMMISYQELVRTFLKKLIGQYLHQCSLNLYPKSI
ncbi:ydjO [Escherichia coli]|nr:ydjO [Escherichia coli]CTW48849.1 ydjO [Escherichia coli]CTZ48608.1 ydjO [Escherichia coli]